MRRRRRTILLAAMALALPLPAYALTQDEPAGPMELSVSASLASCGVSGSQVLCQIDVSFDPIEGAESYTASVTSPDGSVTDQGSVPAGGASVYVPYVGNGTYTVRVSAYGTPPQPGAEPELIESDTADELDSSAEASVGKDERAKVEAELEVGAGGREPSEPPPADAGAPAEAETEISPAEECVPPEPELVPVPELTPEEQAAIDADTERVAAGEPSTLDPPIVEKVAAIEAAEAQNAEATAQAEAACPAP